MGAFQFHFMAIAVDVIDRRDPSNEMRHQFSTAKEYGKAVLSVHITAKGVLPALHN